MMGTYLRNDPGVGRALGLRGTIGDEVDNAWFKITPDDYRNRAKWDPYRAAVEEMVARTSTPHAPWTLVEGNDKLHARLKTIRTLCERLESAL